MKRKRKKDRHEWPIWVEGFRLDEKTGKMKPIKHKLKRTCW